MFGRSKKRAGRPKKLRRLPTRELAPVEEIVEQGLLVADVAVRMSVKNEIIMNALAANLDYDEDQIVELVREAARDIADERENDAEHISLILGEIRIAGRSGLSDTEYRHEDNRTLRHRRVVYQRVAEAMRERSDDESYLRETAERARELAWGEIGESLKDRAMHPYYSGGDNDEYRSNRDDRISQLIANDLTALIKDQKLKSRKRRKNG